MNSKSFASKRIAAGYANDRPFIHSKVIEYIKADLGIEKPFTNGLDIGCGAGLSSKALRLICDKVTGVDISEEMVWAARESLGCDGYEFFKCAAEEVPIPDRLYDIITVAGVVSWVDRVRFLSNTSRLLSENGLLVIYDFWITDKMRECEAYTDWWHNEYLKRYPKPPRDEKIWTAEDVEPFGFKLQKQTSLEADYKFDKAAFSRFMMTQSNVNAKIEGEEQDSEVIKKWFEESLEYIFEDEKRELVFDGYYILCLHKNN